MEEKRGYGKKELFYSLLIAFAVFLLLLVVIIFITKPKPSPVLLPSPDEGLVLDLQLNEGSGTTVKDAAGDNNGVINGAEWFSSTNLNTGLGFLPVDISSCELCRNVSYDGRKANPSWDCVGFNEVLFTQFEEDLNGANGGDMLGAKINCQNEMRSDCQLCIRHNETDSSRENSRWKCGNFDNTELLAEFYNDVNSGDFFDFKVNCQQDKYKNSFQFCARVASDDSKRSSAKWDCVNFDDTPLLIQFTENIGSGNTFDWLVRYNTYVEVPDDDSLDLSSFSLGGVVYLESFPVNGKQSILAKGESPYLGKINYALILIQDSRFGNEAPKIGCEFEDDTDSNWRLLADVDDTYLDSWNHVVCSYDSSQQVWTLYINGQEVNAQIYKIFNSEQNVQGTPMSGGSPLYVGAIYEADDYNERLNPRIQEAFDGKIDSVKVWNRALTSSEVEQDYTDSVNYCVDSDGSDYFIKGTTSLINIINGDVSSYSDACIETEPPGEVLEYICIDNRLSEENGGCDLGCSAGACLSESSVECGNNITETGETCDGIDLVNKDCSDLGFDTGNLSCLDDCSAFDASGCWDYFCGDGICNDTENCSTCPEDCGFCEGVECGNNITETGETCDGTDLNSSCEELGFTGGNLSCNSNCLSFDASNCFSVCGNNITETGETCDGTDLKNRTCADEGYDGGTLSCFSSCNYDHTDCYDDTSDDGGDGGGGGDDDNGVICSATCQSLGYECGVHEICNNLTNCGNCLSNERCVAGKCIERTTTSTTSCSDSCSSLGYECGVHEICGETENCGECEEGICENGVCVDEGKGILFWIIIVILMGILIAIAVVAILIIKERRKKDVMKGFFPGKSKSTKKPPAPPANMNNQPKNLNLPGRGS